MASPSAYLLSLHQSPLQNGGLQRKDCSSCQRRAPNLTVHKLSTNQQLITDPFIYSLPSTAVLAGTTPASMSFRLRCTVANNHAELFFTKQQPSTTAAVSAERCSALAPAVYASDRRSHGQGFHMHWIISNHTKHR